MKLLLLSLLVLSIGIPGMMNAYADHHADLVMDVCLALLGPAIFLGINPCENKKFSCNDKDSMKKTGHPCKNP